MELLCKRKPYYHLGPYMAMLYELHLLLCMSDCSKRAPTQTIKERNMIGARIKIMWEEQLADPPIDYITSVNVT